jgi:hypothetical protein
VRKFNESIEAKHGWLNVCAEINALLDLPINPLNAELNPIRHLLALAGAHHFVDVSRIRFNHVTIIAATALSEDISRGATSSSLFQVLTHIHTHTHTRASESGC